jgi:hypothetical protein
MNKFSFTNDLVISDKASKHYSNSGGKLLKFRALNKCLSALAKTPIFKAEYAQKSRLSAHLFTFAY